VQTKTKASIPEMEILRGQKSVSKPIVLCKRGEKWPTQWQPRTSTAKPGTSHAISA